MSAQEAEVLNSFPTLPGVPDEESLCRRCFLQRSIHVENKCPFEASSFARMTLSEEVQHFADQFFRKNAALFYAVDPRKAHKHVDDVLKLEESVDG